MKFSLRNYIEKNSDLSKKDMYEILKVNQVVDYSYNNFLKKFNGDNLSAKEFLVLNTVLSLNLQEINRILSMGMITLEDKAKRDNIIDTPVSADTLDRLMEFLKEKELLASDANSDDYICSAKFYDRNYSPTGRRRIFLGIFGKGKGFLFETEEEFLFGKLRWTFENLSNFKTGDPLEQAVEEYRALLDLEVANKIWEDPEFYFPEADNELKKKFEEVLPETISGYHKAAVNLNFQWARENKFRQGIVFDGFSELFYYIKLEEDGNKKVFGVFMYGSKKFGEPTRYVIVERDDVFLLDAPGEITYENMNDHDLGFNYDEKGLVELREFKTTECTPKELMAEFKKILK